MWNIVESKAVSRPQLTTVGGRLRAHPPLVATRVLSSTDDVSVDASSGATVTVAWVFAGMSTTYATPMPSCAAITVSVEQNVISVSTKYGDSVITALSVPQTSIRGCEIEPT